MNQFPDHEPPTDDTPSVLTTRGIEALDEAAALAEQLLVEAGEVPGAPNPFADSGTERRHGDTIPVAPIHVVRQLVDDILQIIDGMRARGTARSRNQERFDDLLDRAGTLLARPGVLAGVGRKDQASATLDPTRTVVRVLTGPHSGATVIVPGRGSVTLGRSDHCEVRIPGSKDVSRRHAKLSWHEGRLFISDLGSTNGVRVRGCLVGEAAVEPGQVVSLGKIDLVFENDGDDPAPEPAEANGAAGPSPEARAVATELMELRGVSAQLSRADDAGERRLRELTARLVGVQETLRRPRANSLGATTGRRVRPDDLFKR